MTQQQQPAPPPGSSRSWWRRWWTVVLGVAGGLLLALVAAVGALFALYPIMGADPICDWGTGLWLLSAGLVGSGIAAPPGPARRARIVVGLLVAVGWFVVGRFVFGP